MSRLRRCLAVEVGTIDLHEVYEKRIIYGYEGSGGAVFQDQPEIRLFFCLLPPPPRTRFYCCAIGESKLVPTSQTYFRSFLHSIHGAERDNHSSFRDPVRFSAACPHVLIYRGRHFRRRGHIHHYFNTR